MKKSLISIIILNLLCMPVFALQFDTSIDDEIRRNYNPSKLEEDVALPALPKILTEKPTTIKTVSQTTKPIQTQKINQIKKSAQIQNTPQNQQQGIYAVLHQGTKFRVKLLSSVSDRSKKGTKVSFVSRYPVSATYLTIPSGTHFYGEIVESHRPQLSGNGGLIAIKVNSLVLGDGTHPIDAYVTEANFKKVFFNNIKGQRRYIKSMFKSMKPGGEFFKKMWMATGNLMQDGSTIIITPFSFACGALAVAANVATSPVLALFYKGDSIYLREGSDFEIELSQDVYIYN